MFEDYAVDIRDANGKIYHGIVVSCEDGVGVSIIKEDDHKHFLLCVFHPSTPTFQKRANEVYGSKGNIPKHIEEKCMREFKDIFSYVRSCIELGGIIDYDTLSEMAETAQNSTGSNCPFGA